MNPTPYRLFRRQQRLSAASRETEAELPHDELRRLRHLSTKGYLVGEMAGSTEGLMSTCPSVHLLLFTRPTVHIFICSSYCPPVLVSPS